MGNPTFHLPPPTSISRASPEVTPAFLPSSLGRTHPFILGYSPRAPVSVFRYGHLVFNLRGFSWKALRCRCSQKRAPSLPRFFPFKGVFRIFLEHEPRKVEAQAIKTRQLISFVTPSEKLGGAGILTGFPSAAPFGMTLGPA